jgi:hypothetical protein
MKFKDHIPPSVIENNPNVGKIISVFDGLAEHKNIMVGKSHRLPFISSTDDRLLRKKLISYGHAPLPGDFSKDIVDALINNSSHLMRLKGSKLGLKLWLWCLTFSDVSFDDSTFIPIEQYIVLGDFTRGYISHAQPSYTPPLYLFSGTTNNFGANIFELNISTMYHYKKSIRKYIKDNLKDFLPFVSVNTTIKIKYTPGSYTKIDFPFQYFVKQ